jgi:O-antigen ligase
MSVMSRPSGRRQAGLLGVILLSACTAPLLDIGGITLTGDRLLGLAAVIAVAVIALRGGLRWTPVHSALGLFAGIQVLTSILAAVSWPQGPKFAVVYILGFACFALSAAWAGGSAGPKQGARLWITVGAVLGVAGGLIGFFSNVWQTPLRGSGLVRVLGSDPGRNVFAAKVTFQEWNLYSGFLVVAFALALWSWRSDAGGRLRRWSGALLVGAVAQGLVFGSTRAAWIAMAALAALWVWARGPAWWQVGALVLLVALGLLLQAVAIGTSPLYFRVLTPVKTGLDKNLAVRLAVNRATIESWRERPVLGKGAGSINGIEVRLPTGGPLRKTWNGNLVLFVLHDSGLLGLAALAWLLAVVARMGRRALRQGAHAATRSVLVPLLAAGVALLFAYQFTHALWLMYPYVYLGLLTAAMDSGAPLA